MASYLVLLGPPGAGKGTQAKRLSRELHLPQVSSGDIFREHLEAGTELGEAAREYIDRGQLVPDDVTVAMIRERLSQPDCTQGAILDGFPRTMAQVEGLDDMLAEMGASLDAVIHVQVPLEELIRRLTGRLVCRAEGHIYHRDFNPPEEPGICDIDGSELYTRDDDKEETVRKRINVYKEQTAPLIEHYEQRGILVRVNGAQPVEEVTEELISVVQKKA